MSCLNKPNQRIFVAGTIATIIFCALSAFGSSPSAPTATYLFQHVAPGSSIGMGNPENIDVRFFMYPKVIKVYRSDLLGQDIQRFQIVPRSKLKGVTVSKDCMSKNTIYAGRIVTSSRYNGSHYLAFAGIAIKPLKNKLAYICVTQVCMDPSQPLVCGGPEYQVKLW